MTTDPTNPYAATCVSIGLFAWNEEAAIQSTLVSLFQQTLFERLSRRGSRCEIFCVANGCTDRTPQVAEAFLQQQEQQHPYAHSFIGRVENLAQRGKVNAWNQFVHSLSARQARFLFMMDADILLHRSDTLWNMLEALENDREASVAVDRPCKDILSKPKRSLNERLSLAASNMTLAAEGQLCGQLYCIRAELARKIYLPKDLAACEDGFIKALVCTDFLAHEVRPERIRLAERAEHTFEAYTSPASILKNQKRQIIGQTIVHILVDDYLKTLTPAERERCGEVLRANDARDPSWLKRLISAHLQRTRCFWRLYPGLLGQRFERLKRLGFPQKLLCLPAAVAGFVAALISSFLAYRSLRSGCTDYWPKAARLGLKTVSSSGPPALQWTATSKTQE